MLGMLEGRVVGRKDGGELGVFDGDGDGRLVVGDLSYVGNIMGGRLSPMLSLNSLLSSAAR
jgi:hypothetical protein